MLCAARGRGGPPLHHDDASAYWALVTRKLSDSTTVRFTNRLCYSLDSRESSFIQEGAPATFKRAVETNPRVHRLRRGRSERTKPRTGSPDRGRPHVSGERRTVSRGCPRETRATSKRSGAAGRRATELPTERGTILHPTSTEPTVDPVMQGHFYISALVSACPSVTAYLSRILWEIYALSARRYVLEIVINEEEFIKKSRVFAVRFCIDHLNEITTWPILLTLQLRSTLSCSHARTCPVPCVRSSLSTAEAANISNSTNLELEITILETPSIRSPLILSSYAAQQHSLRAACARAGAAPARAYAAHTPATGMGRGGRARRTRRPRVTSPGRAFALYHSHSSRRPYRHGRRPQLLDTAFLVIVTDILKGTSWRPRARPGRRRPFEQKFDKMRYGSNLGVHNSRRENIRLESVTRTAARVVRPRAGAVGRA
ncbi:hypothetical protein EVAR_83804_1 [Eumeta japonica]|uniref:Uncharacterized protein n=1 Tax=Eumeta variegata TaxID=151549 RepID=A0A4C1WIC4_EUMVA|nr:hypothetical protein EVAR_83804_1 [Eumeta japonica]